MQALTPAHAQAIAQAGHTITRDEIATRGSLTVAETITYTTGTGAEVSAWRPVTLRTPAAVRRFLETH